MAWREMLVSVKGKTEMKGEEQTDQRIALMAGSVCVTVSWRKLSGSHHGSLGKVLGLGKVEEPEERTR